jgi:hypothetical protein
MYADCMQKRGDWSRGWARRNGQSEILTAGGAGHSSSSKNSLRPLFPAQATNALTSAEHASADPFTARQLRSLTASGPHCTLLAGGLDGGAVVAGRVGDDPAAAVDEPSMVHPIPYDAS